MKEIIILTISMGNDGAERVLSELSREWVNQGNKVSIIQTGAGNYGVNYCLSEQIEIINIKAKSKVKPIRYIQEIRKTVKILKERPNATVISFIVASIFICGVASFFVNNRIVVSERNNPKECPAGKLQQKLRDWAFTRANVCVFQTEEAMNLFPQKAREKGVIIPNPINGKLPDPYEGERRKVIVAACRLHPQKNLPMLLEAFSMFHEAHPDYVLEIYGQGKERNRLEMICKEKGIKDCVRMPGFCNDILNKMRDATMYVSTSDYEGISNSMLEAMGMGVPVVVTDCPVGGARMVIKNNINGLIVPVGDAYSFYMAMKKIVEDGDFSMRISNEAQKIKKIYPITRISQKWIEVL